MTRKHILIMLACCLIPLTAFGAIALFNVPLSKVLWFGLILLCPLSHILMMKFMMNDKHDHSMIHSDRPSKTEFIEIKKQLPSE